MHPLVDLSASGGLVRIMSHPNITAIREETISVFREGVEKFFRVKTSIVDRIVTENYEIYDLITNAFIENRYGMSIPMLVVLFNERFVQLKVSLMIDLAVHAAHETGLSEEIDERLYEAIRRHNPSSCTEDHAKSLTVELSD